MVTLLRVDASPMREHSISRKLTSQFTDTWAKAHPHGKIITRDLSKASLLPVDETWIAASWTPQAARTAEQNQALSMSDLLVGELEQADEYVFG